MKESQTGTGQGRICRGAYPEMTLTAALVGTVWGILITISIGVRQPAALGFHD